MSVQEAPRVHPFRRTSIASAFVGLLAVVIGVVLILAGGPVQAKPPGNNGTVKIVGVLDDQPQNQPHVPCTFSVEWFGFDAGATSVVDFSLQPPTSDGTMNVVGDTTPTLDANGYALKGYTLSFTGEPQPNQGFHVKMLVTTTGSQGNDTKSKVFWAGPCSEPTPTGTPTVTPTETPTETVTPTPTETPTETVTPTPTETVVPPTETPTSTPSVAPPTATVAPPAPTAAPTTGATVSVPSLVQAGLSGHKVSAIWGGGLVGGGLVALLFAGVLFLGSRRPELR